LDETQKDVFPNVSVSVSVSGYVSVFRTGEFAAAHPAQNGTFLSASPMSVPSLSWQNDHFYIKREQKVPFCAPNLNSEVGRLGLDAQVSVAVYAGCVEGKPRKDCPADSDRRRPFFSTFRLYIVFVPSLVW
jgi:hypothetical protein